MLDYFIFKDYMKRREWTCVGASVQGGANARDAPII